MFLVRRDRSSDRSLVTQQDGSASVEYAVLFGVVIICLAVGVYCLGQMSKAGFSTAAAGVNSVLPDALAKAQRDTSNTPPTPAAPPQPEAIPQWQIVTLGAVMFIACMAPLTYIIVKPMLQKDKSEEDEQEDSQTKRREVPSAEQQAFENRQKLRRVFQNNMASLLQGRLKVRQIMSRQLTVVRKSESVQAVQELMELKKIRYVVVSDKEGTLLGIISRKDVDSRTGKRAGDIMTSNPIALDADSDISPAVTMLVSKRISCLPITSEGKLAGILTTTDFLMALQCALTTLASVAEHLAPSGRSAKPACSQRAAQIANADSAETQQVTAT